MLKIAIVGNIASGKSTVERLIAGKGYKVFDSDKICHNLLGEISELYEIFKSYDVFNNGKFDREKLGKLVFANSELKIQLETCIYKHLKLELNKIFDDNKSETFVFVSVPLLFEANMEYLFDRVIFIYCDDDIRLKRLINRNNYTEEYAKIRLNSQISQGEKVPKSDYIIYNNSTQDYLETQVFSLIEQIR